MSYITTYCHIDENFVRVNGKLILEYDHSSENNWMKQVYKSLEMQYPKFYKMDVLSKAGFAATEFLKQANENISDYGDDAISILLSNSCSSLDTDEKFEESYKKEGAPGPALFVYTLPNIVVGEITIFNKWYGESMFVIRQKFDPELWQDWVETSFAEGSEACLGGWIDVADDKVECFVFFIEKEDTKSLNLPLSALGSGLLQPRAEF